MITKFSTTPIIYYPTNPARNMLRVEMVDDNTQIAWADLFVEDGWAHFVYVYVHPEYRSEETIMAFIRSAFNLDFGTINIYWFNISPSVANFYHKIVAERPDLTFAADGAINQIIWASE